MIGAGPAGVYSSDIFLRQLKKTGAELGLGENARIDLFEKLPVPFGLVRYGVAPDHPSIKFIADALEKTLDNPDIHLYCDVEFGKDVTLDELLARYDAVLFATGAVEDKPLGLPGADLDGVYGAAKFVEWYDGYPTGARTWPLEAEEVAVIGGGNVAMDVARELMRNADDLKARTDIPDNVYEGIKANKARVLHLFIRRGVAQAKFSVQELREMEKLPGVQLIINEDDFELDDDTIEEAGKDKLTRQMVEELFAIREMAEDMEDDGDVDFEGNPADRKYYIHFNSAPTEVLGEDGKVAAIRVERTETGADGQRVADRPGNERRGACRSAEGSDRRRKRQQRQPRIQLPDASGERGVVAEAHAHRKHQRIEHPGADPPLRQIDSRQHARKAPCREKGHNYQTAAQGHCG